MNAPYTFVSIAAPSAIPGDCAPAKAPSKAPPGADVRLIDLKPLIGMIRTYARYAGKGIESLRPLDDYAAYLSRNFKRFMHQYSLKEEALLALCVQIWHKDRPRGRYGRPMTTGGLRARMAAMACQARKAVIAKYADKQAEKAAK